MKRFLQRNPFILYLTKFIGIFCACYFGTLAIIGLSAPGGYYNKTIHDYFNYISWLRSSLLHASKWVLSFFYPDTYIKDDYLLKVRYGYGVRMVYSCLGFGIMSFWIAFIIANRGKTLKKLKWIFGGLLLVWLINIARIVLLVYATNKHWKIPYFDHHTWFNIFAYLLIFILIYFYDKSFKKLPPSTNTDKPAVATT